MIPPAVASKIAGMLPWRAVGVGFAVVGVVAGVYLAYRHYDGLVESNHTLAANNAVLQSSLDLQRSVIAEQADAIGEWKMALEAFQQVASDLQRTSDGARSEVRRLNELFTKHDLERLARQKPALVEGRINAGSDRAMLLLECATAPGGVDCADDGGEAGSPALRP